MLVCLHFVLIHSLPYYFSLSFNCLFLSAFLHLLLERDFDEFCRTADCHQYGDAIVRKHSVNYKPIQKKSPRYPPYRVPW